MNFRRVTTDNLTLFEEWKDYMDEKGIEYTSKVTETDGLKAYNVFVDQKKVYLILNYKEPGKPPATIKDMTKGQKIAFGCLGVIALLIAVSIGMGLYLESQMPDLEPKTVEDMTDEQYQMHLNKTYGLYSDWMIGYSRSVKATYPNYPRTFKKEGVRVIPINRDSFTHVFLWSAENAFGQRTDHSVTSVVETKTGNVLRVVSAH
jgi:hypothetical protein